MLFILMSMIGLLLLGLIIRSGPGGPGAEFLISLFGGAMFGLAAFATIWSGLFGQSWIRSYVEAVGLSVLGIGLMLLPTREARDSMIFVILMIPLYAVTLSLPLWCMRYLKGWRLLCEQPPPEHHRGLGIEDILLVTTVIASAIMLSQSAVRLMPFGGVGQSILMGVVTSSIVMGLVSAPLSLIAVRIGLTITKPEVLFGRMVIFWLSSWFLLILFITFTTRGNTPGEAIGFTFIASLSGFSTLGLGLACFILDGNLLFSNKKAALKNFVTQQTLVAEKTDTSDLSLAVATNPDIAIRMELPSILAKADGNVALIASENAAVDTVNLSSAPGLASAGVAEPLPTSVIPAKPFDQTSDPFAEEEEAMVGVAERSVKRPGHWMDRCLAIGMLLFSFMFSIIVYWREQNLEVATEAVVTDQSKRLDVLQPFGTLEQQDGTLYRFKAAPSSNDALVLELRAHTSLESLDLSGSKITNYGAALAVQFQSLQELDLSHTLIDDSVFQAVPIGKYQKKCLNLSGTNITGQGLQEIARTVRCDKIILRGLKISPEEIDQLSGVTSTILDLRGVKLSSLPKKATHLILGENDLPAESTNDLAQQLETIEIESMILTDEVFDHFIKQHPKLKAISLSKTPLTGKAVASLGALASLQILTIGPGTEITEEDLINHQPSVRVLRVHDPNFQGKFLNSISPTVQVLDLSYSGVNDSEILKFSPDPSDNLYQVNLSHTAISYKSLGYLAKHSIGEIDIRGTKITSNEIINLQPSFPSRLIIDPGQFSRGERNRISRKSLFRLELRSIVEGKY